MVMNWEQFIRKLFELAQPYLKVRDDFVHTRLAHQYAVLLLKKEGGDKKIVEPAVILHDVGWSQLKPEQIKGAFGVRAAGENATRLNRVHEIKGARIAREILEKLGYEAALIEKIVRIVERHDSGHDPQSIEEKLVKDADKLWRFSKTGYAYEMRRQKLTHAVRFHFLNKNMDRWFFTKTAQKLAQTELRERSKEMQKV
jgi:HD superfamily phosphodiesterase